MESKLIEILNADISRLQKRIGQGTMYIREGGKDPRAPVILRELEYRELWTRRFLGHAKLLKPETIGKEIYIASPLGQINRILAIMLGSPSGVENRPLITALAQYECDHRIWRMNRFMTELESGWNMTPGELIDCVCDYALDGYLAWIDFRITVTGIK